MRSCDQFLQFWALNRPLLEAPLMGYNTFAQLNIALAKTLKESDRQQSLSGGNDSPLEV